jgi:hypothetical protein
MDGIRILVASALAKVVEQGLQTAFPDSKIVSATTPDLVRRAVRGQVRFDVVSTDLTWSDKRYEWDFDGLDVVQMLRDANRPAPVILAAQGHGIEVDHLTEALDTTEFPEVMGVLQKAAGLSTLVNAVRIAARGDMLPVRDFPTGINLKEPTIHGYFKRGRGRTAGHLAAAVASGGAQEYRELATTAQVPLDTANKVHQYLRKLILDRNEYPSVGELTKPAVYRWCGEHARYLLSWSRRHDPPDKIITRWRP